MSKHILVIVPGADETAESKDTEIDPGSTVSDLLTALGKQASGWTAYLRTANGDVTLKSDADLYERVSEGQKVFLEPAQMVVG